MVCLSLLIIHLASSHNSVGILRFKLLLKSPDSSDGANGGDDDGDSETIIRTNAFEKGVLALPGTVFLPDGRKTAYVRASFSLLSEEDVNEALRRLKEVILEARRT